MLIPEVERVYEQSLNKWRIAPKGIVIYSNECLSITRMPLLLIKKMVDSATSKNTTVKILVIVPNESTINNINSDILNDPSLEVYLKHVDLLTVNSPKPNDSAIIHYDLLIMIKPDKYVINGTRQFPLWLSETTYKFLLVISRDYQVSTWFPGVTLIENLTRFNSISVSKFKNTSYLLPVELSSKERMLYDEHSVRITDTIAIFGNIDLIYKCIGQDGLTYRTNVAISKGWNMNLDPIHNEFDAEICKYFSPSAIFTKCSEFNDSVSHRNRIIANSVSKLNVIIDVISRNPTKKIGIINKNSTYALELSDLINKSIANPNVNPFADLLEKTIIPGVCGNFNNNIESIKLDGVKTKAGGEKVFGTVVQNKKVNEAFNNDRCKVVSFSNVIPEYADFTFDIIIICSPDCTSLLDIRQKVAKFNLTSQGYTLYLYCDSTKESKEVLESPIFSKIEGKITIKNVDEI